MGNENTVKTEDQLRQKMLELSGKYLSFVESLIENPEAVSTEKIHAMNDCFRILDRIKRMTIL